MLKVHDEWSDLAWKSYNLNESDKSLSYYLNKWSSVQLTSSTVTSNGLESLDAKEPTIKQSSNLYLNSNRWGSADLDRVSIWWTITDNYGGWLWTHYDSVASDRPYNDGQLLNCYWAGSVACTIWDDIGSTTPSWNVKSWHNYDYAFFIK